MLKIIPTRIHHNKISKTAIQWGSLKYDHMLNYKLLFCQHNEHGPATVKYFNKTGESKKILKINFSNIFLS